MFTITPPSVLAAGRRPACAIANPHAIRNSANTVVPFRRGRTRFRKDGARSKRGWCILFILRSRASITLGDFGCGSFLGGFLSRGALFSFLVRLLIVRCCGGSGIFLSFLRGFSAF